MSSFSGQGPAMLKDQQRFRQNQKKYNELKTGKSPVRPANLYSLITRIYHTEKFSAFKLIIRNKSSALNIAVHNQFSVFAMI